MIIAPVAELDLVIRETLAEVRKGIATARQKNQTNPATGLMADLPEFVDFEIVVVTEHQSSSFVRASGDGEAASSSIFESGSRSGSELQSSSGSEIQSGSEVESTSGSES